MVAHYLLSMDLNFKDTTMLPETIVGKVFLRKSNPIYQGVEEADYLDRIRLKK